MRTLLVMVLLAAHSDAQAAFQWPWDHAHHASHHRHVYKDMDTPKAGTVTPFAEPKTDCKSILDAVKKMGGQYSNEWLDQMNMLTDGQRSNIAKCLRDSPP